VEIGMVRCFKRFSDYGKEGRVGVEVGSETLKKHRLLGGA